MLKKSKIHGLFDIKDIEIGNYEVSKESVRLIMRKKKFRVETTYKIKGYYGGLTVCSQAYPR